jgi:hypothetical protein
MKAVVATGWSGTENAIRTDNWNYAFKLLKK